MQYFAWKTFGPPNLANPIAPAVTIEIPGPNGQPIAIEGLFDTGADVTELHTSFIGTLGIPLNQCAAIKTHGLDSPTTVVIARLDGQEFDLPVTFFDNVAGNDIVNLIGRMGIFDKFRVMHDPQQQRTGFDWLGALPPSQAVADYEAYLNAWLAQNPGGFAWGVNYP